jgi:1-acyl-sn-glycerol-3-phosphate acyltransferase
VKLYPGTAHIVFHAPIESASYANRDELLNAVRQAIASSLPEWMVEEKAI